MTRSARIAPTTSGTSDIQGLVDYWIQYPNIQGVMPAKLVTGQAAQDVAAYVAAVAARPGQDTGALGSAVQQVQQKPPPSRTARCRSTPIRPGQLKFTASSATATAGSGDDEDEERVRGARTTSASRATASTRSARVVTNGGTSTVTVTLKPGTYTFYCSVDGHEAAGMKGTLTVK